MDSNERATYLLKKIWEDNDLDAVECFRTLIKNESLILYREKQEDLNYRPLFYHGEPIVHEYSLSPLAYEIDIKRLISLIGKNDTIGFAVYGDIQNMECGDNYPIHIHILSGLVSKLTENHVFMFPHVVRARGSTIVSNGNVVEYITVADQRHHCGKVQNVEGNKVWIKEYAGYSFEHNDGKLFQQDSWVDKVVCLPLDACVLLSKDDYRVDDMNHASTIRALWTSPCLEACNELRSWFSTKGDETIVYYIECENEKPSLESPYLYTIRELAEREAASRTMETIRRVEIPESYVKGNAFLVPNTDGAAKEMGAKVTYIKRNWSVIEISISDLVSKFPADRYKFQVDGMFDFRGDPVVECSVIYSPTTELVSTRFMDLDEERNKSYLCALDSSNCKVPEVGSVVQYCDRTCLEPIIAKVTAIENDMVRVAEWDGITYRKEATTSHGQDDWTSCSYVFVPIAACELIPDITLSSAQLKGLLCFKDENKLSRAPWAQFHLSEKIPFDVDSIIEGLENLRYTTPEMFVRWIRFISSDYLINIDPEVLKMAEQYVSWMDSIDDYGDGTDLKEQLDARGVDFVDLIDEMSIAIEKRFFPETDDSYWEQ